jgi:glutamate-1-semialdehyde 2,1-aminomutase
VPSSAVDDTIVAPYNVVPELDERVACVIVEPVAANMGVVAPAPGFLEGLRSACTAVGALLVFDEVITGFRVGPGGMSARTGVVPDLWCFGKVIGGGLPVGAFGGRRDVLSVLAPDGPVYQAGTLSGNPLATAAGLAVLATVAAADYDVLSARAGRLAAGLATAIAAAGIPVRVSVVGPLVGLFFGDEPVTDYASARASVAGGVYAQFFSAMRERGVALAPGPYEAMFPGLAHLDQHLDAVVEAAAEAAAHVAAHRSSVV